MAEITGTEVVAPELRRVELGSASFKVPASPTLKYMFWMRRFVQKFQDGNIADDDIVDCYEQTVEFLRRYNKTVDEDALQESCELTDLVMFYARCFGAADEEEQEVERPTRTRGGASKSGSGRSRSRSAS